MTLSHALRRLAAARERFVSQIARFDPLQISVRPAPDRWSALEIFEHLVLAELAVLRGCPSPDALEPLAMGEASLFRRLSTATVLRLRIAVTVPSATMLPSGRSELAVLRRRWNETFSWIEALPEALGPARVGLPFFSHPVAGSLTLEQAALLNTLHVAGHARQVRKLPGSSGGTRAPLGPAPPEPGAPADPSLVMGGSGYTRRRSPDRQAQEAHPNGEGPAVGPVGSGGVDGGTVITPVVVHCGFGGLLAAGSLPLALRWVPMNRLYGIRVPKAFVSDSNWYAINAYGGRILMAYGVALLAFGLSARDAAPPPTSIWTAVLIVGPMLLVFPLLALVNAYARRLP